MSLKDREDGYFTPAGLVQILGLILSILLVAMVYSTIIRPKAEEYLIAEEYGMEAQATQSGNIFVVMKDYEQQACFTLMFWVILILGYKAWQVNAEKSVLTSEETRHDMGDLKNAMLLYPDDGKIFLPTAAKMVKHLEAYLEKNTELQGKLLPHLLLKGLHRFMYSGSIQESSDVVKGRIDVTADRLDSELSIIRYIAWAIPSIGFIGTVRGIGAGLAKAPEAVEGDISGVTESLGLAFNSTLVALFISIFLMFFIHILQSRQEGTILAIETFCREHLIDRFRIYEEEEEVIVAQEEDGEEEEGNTGSI